MNNEDKYRDMFDIARAESGKAERALEAALDIRKFEIELYWKRATYFWALIAVAFAGHFTILSARWLEEPDKSTYAFMVAVIGFVFTFAWFLANKGSKFWQENWENHVDMLEDAVIGPLYKTVLHRPVDDEAVWLRRVLGSATRPATFSVSGINAWIGIFCLGIWCLLLVKAANFDWTSSPDGYKIASVAFGIAMCVIMRTFGRTYAGEYHHVMRIRKTKISRASNRRAHGG
jgi:hypothetical protein